MTAVLEPDVYTASFTADGWFRTGDAARLDPDGFHRIVGRQSSDLIKTGGYRVGAGEANAAILIRAAAAYFPFGKASRYAW